MPFSRAIFIPFCLLKSQSLAQLFTALYDTVSSRAATPLSTFSAHSQLHSTVGYNSRSLDLSKDGWKLIAFNFETVGETDTGVAFDRVLNVTGIQPVSFDDATINDKGARIMLRDPQTGDYTDFIYINDAGENYDETGWADTGDGFLVDGKIKVDLGFGAWLRLGDDVDEGVLNVAGEVIGDSSVRVDFYAGWSILANPYPFAIDLSKITTLVDPVSFDQATINDAGARIMIREETTGSYTDYIYINDAGENYDETGWADTGDGFIITGNVIPVGHAFWMRSEKDGALKFEL